jgi:zinc transporter ZupT
VTQQQQQQQRDWLAVVYDLGAGAADAGLDAGKWRALALAQPPAVQAVAATLFISLVPLVLLGVLPLRQLRPDAPLLRTLVSFAVGGLLGDVFLHLLPHALASGGGHDGHSHGHAHAHAHGQEGALGGLDQGLRVGLGVLGGFLAFFLIDKLVRLVGGDGGHGHAHGTGSSTHASPVRQLVCTPRIMGLSDRVW